MPIKNTNITTKLADESLCNLLKNRFLIYKHLFYKRTKCIKIIEKSF